MIRLLPENTGSIYAFEISGQLTADDIESVAPVYEQLFENYEQIQMLCVLRDFEGFTPQGDWAKTRWIFEHMQRVQCVAVVGPEADAQAVAMSGAAVGGRPVEVFLPEQQAEAVAWLKSFSD